MVSGVTVTACGSSTIAVVPPYGDARSVTLIPCLAGEPADHEQAELVAVGQVELRRAGQPLVERRPAPPRRCRARGPRPRSRSRWPTRSARDLTRVCGGENVVAFSISSASRWITSATAAPGHGVARLGDDVDPGVVLDLGDRAAQHVDDRHRVAPAPAGRRAGQDDQALRVPAHAGGEVVEPEQVLERRRARWCARSIASSSASCRCSSDWLRRARLRKTWLTPLRRLAWPTAASTAVRCTAENASRDLGDLGDLGRPAAAPRRDVDVLALAAAARPRRGSRSSASARAPAAGRSARG